MHLVKHFSKAKIFTEIVFLLFQPVATFCADDIIIVGNLLFLKYTFSYGNKEKLLVAQSGECDS